MQSKVPGSAMVISAKGCTVQEYLGNCALKRELLLFYKPGTMSTSKMIGSRLALVRISLYVRYIAGFCFRWRRDIHGDPVFFANTVCRPILEGKRRADCCNQRPQQE